MRAEQCQPAIGLECVESDAVDTSDQNSSSKKGTGSGRGTLFVLSAGASRCESGISPCAAKVERSSCRRARSSSLSMHVTSDEPLRDCSNNRRRATYTSLSARLHLRRLRELEANLVTVTSCAPLRPAEHSRRAEASRLNAVVIRCCRRRRDPEVICRVNREVFRSDPTRFPSGDERRRSASVSASASASAAAAAMS